MSKVMAARDSADPELIQAGDGPRGAFVVVALERGGEVGRFRFAISPAGRTLIQQILGTRPFGVSADLPYRYFYAGQGGYGSPITHLLYVRVELGREVRTLELESPEDVVTALEWFRRVPNLGAAAHLSTPLD